jgi:hypothetical protein
MEVAADIPVAAAESRMVAAPRILAADTRAAALRMLAADTPVAAAHILRRGPTSPDTRAAAGARTSLLRAPVTLPFRIAASMPAARGPSRGMRRVRLLSAEDMLR